ncbi:hypothetical protein [Actinomycetospora sp. NBRC 106375]|uniref:hypothetical protein n=1 Tax=Actinomycetospora sp. NBRC 106375 TaxID=3032207 RepID=UPI002552F557|nr:hypothetical protein [Actinomycetospora sp. NBRC 106375]
MSSTEPSTEPEAPPGRPPAPASGTSTPAPAAAPLLPGSPAARAAGCACSVLANAAYRCGASTSPLIEPTCVVHLEPT